MRVLASHAVESDISAGKHQKAPGLFPAPIAPVSVKHSESALIQRKANCACGGGCPSCAEEEHAGNIQTKLQVSNPGDQYEQEADRVAEQVLHGNSVPVKASGVPNVARDSLRGSSHSHGVPSALHDLLRLPGQQLDTSVRSFMESKFGYDFAPVRVHVDRQAAASAIGVRARAYTVGEHIVFGAGEYQPGSSVGQQLIAHELTHVIQQSGAGDQAPKGIVQRVPTLDIVDENFVGPLSQAQRRAAKSCPINCCLRRLGTLHAMPLQQQQDRGVIVPAGSPLATGIGAALHFIAEATQPRAGDLCHCDDFRMIQVLESNEPADPRGNSFVDNASRPTPFYGDVGWTGRGEDPIPAGYVDAGETVATTESIYDRPFRTQRRLAAAGLATDFSWMAEACVACIKNTGPDRILGCATYGFTRAYDAATHNFGPVVEVSPGCLSRPTAHFIMTLGADPTTAAAAYDFSAGPDLDECMIGDFPTPRGDTRMA